MKYKVAVPMFIILSMAAESLLAQEVCFEDAKSNFNEWRGTHGKTLDELSARFEASSDPYTEMIEYNGMTMPVAAALIIEGEKYGKVADEKLHVEIDRAKDCSGNTAIPRGVYDLAREWLGLTTILPEKATRIDFEELRRGNLPGGKNSVIREAGRKIDETFNPFRWRF